MGDAVNDTFAVSVNRAQIARAVARWGTARFPDDTRKEWANAAAMEIDLAGYVPAARHVMGPRASTRGFGEASPASTHGPTESAAASGHAIHQPGLTVS